MSPLGAIVRAPYVSLPLRVRAPHLCLLILTCIPLLLSPNPFVFHSLFLPPLSLPIQLPVHPTPYVSIPYIFHSLYVPFPVSPMSHNLYLLLPIHLHESPSHFVSQSLYPSLLVCSTPYLLVSPVNLASICPLHVTGVINRVTVTCIEVTL